jgi:PAS domain S-box-containing protein
MKHALAPQPMSARAGFVRSPLAAIVLLAVATGITGAVYLKHQSAAFRLAAEKSLLSVAALKTGQISDWYSECRLDAEAILQNPMTMTRLRQFLLAPPGTDPAMDIQAWMESRRELRGYHQFVLYDALGVPRLHAPASAPDAEVPTLIDNPEFRTALRAGGIQAGDLQPALADSGRFSLDFWVPVASAPGANAPALGVILLDIDPDRSLFPLIQSWPTASRTAETLLIRREGNDVVFLNRLRHRTNIPLAFRVPIDPHGHLPAALATLGQEGTVSGRDYRGVPVLAALRRIPGTPWFMVAKEDLAEIDAPLRERARSAGGVLLLIFVAAALGVNQLGRRREAGLLHQRISAKRESAEGFRTLVESLPQLVWTCLSDGRCDYLSRQWVQYTGIPEQDQLGYRWAEQLHPDDRLRTRRDWQDAVETGGPFAPEFRIRRADGTYRWFQTRAVPLRNAAGRIEKWFGTNTDIDERKRTEEALHRTTEVLRQSIEEVRQFAHIVTHDLRGPLVNFRGFASELRRSLADLDLLTQPAINQLGDDDRATADRIFHRDVPESLGFMDSSVIRMDHMINALLRLSRLAHHELVPERLDLGSMVAEILASLGAQIEARSATVSVLPLPEVTADRASLEQILSNILGNAVLYLDPARPGRIEVSGELSGAELRMKIDDNGRGIAQNDREKVFAPFRRGGDRDVPGEGMGLAYVQALVRRQGGRIWFESEPGVGTTFSFVLPIVRS